jgi:hypothetical protein
MHRQTLWMDLICAARLAATAAPLYAQSLADVSRKEEKRRQTIKAPSKVYTNKDLGNVPPTAAPPADAAKPDDPSEPPADAKADEAANAKTDDAAKDTTKAPVKDQAYWSGRLTDLRTQLSRDQAFAEALQSRINALTTDFVNRSDPAQRAVIEKDRQAALTEMDRLTKAIETDKKAIADLEEEARRAGVPPGWLR